MSSSTVLGGEVTDRAAGVALVADHGDRAVTLDAVEHPQRDLALVNLRRREFRGAWSAVRGEQGVQPQPVEESAVAGAIAVVGGVSRASGRLWLSPRLTVSRDLAHSTGVESTSSSGSW